MNRKHLLSTAALIGCLAGGLTLSSCKDEITKPTAAEGSTTDATGVNVAQMAQTYPALAYVPAKADTYVTFNVGKILQIIEKSKTRVCAPTQDALKALDSVAVATSSENAKCLNDLQPLIAKAIKLGFSMEIMKGLSVAFSPEMMQIATTALGTKNEEEILMETANTLAGYLTELKPLYTVAKLSPGQEAVLQQIRELDKQQQVTSIPGLDSWFENGWSGVCVDLSKAPQDMLAEVPPTVLEKLKNSKFYLVYRVEGDTIISALATNPADLEYAATPETSVLATASAATLNVAAGQNALLAANIGTNILNAVNNLSKTTITTPAAVLTDFFNAVAQQQPNMAGEMQKAVTGINNVATELLKLSPEQKHPLTLVLWHDGDLHMQADCDACGMEFTQAPVNTQAPENAILHAYGTNISNLPALNLDAIITGAFTVGKGIAYTMESRPRQELLNNIMGVEFIYRMLPGFAKPLISMHESLGNGWSCSVTKAPESATGHVVADFNLADRAALEQGWKETTQVALNIASFVDKSAVDAIKQQLEAFTTTTDGKATVYTWAQGSQMLGITPGCAVTDTKLVIGSDAATNAKRANTASSTNFSGIGIHVNLNHVPDCEKILPFMEGGVIRITTQGGKMSTRLDLTTPILK